MAGRCKKKIDTELEIYFPEHENEELLNYYSDLKKMLQEGSKYYSGKKKSEDFIKAKNAVFNRLKPKNLNMNDANNDIIKMEKSFENYYSILEENGVRDPQDLSLFKFYHRLNHLRERFSE